MEVGINSPPIKQVVALYLQKPAWPDVRTNLELVFSNRLVIALSVCKISLLDFRDRTQNALSTMLITQISHLGCFEHF